MSSQLPRTRIIPIGDFYTRLQLEYLCYKFRYLIYQRPFEKKKFADICAKKREKIDQIALENCLPSIFNHAGQREHYLQKFFKKAGLPNFCYRDDYQARVKGYWDVVYYFMVGTSVRYVYNDEVTIGRVKCCDVNNRVVTVETEDVAVQRPFTEVTRIFPSNFYESFFHDPDKPNNDPA
jgi:hypothetical protein